MRRLHPTTSEQTPDLVIPQLRPAPSICGHTKTTKVLMILLRLDGLHLGSMFYHKPLVLLLSILYRGKLNRTSQPTECISPGKGKTRLISENEWLTAGPAAVITAHQKQEKSQSMVQRAPQTERRPEHSATLNQLTFRLSNASLSDMGLVVSEGGDSITAD